MTARFDGGRLSSDAGGMLLGEVDESCLLPPGVAVDLCHVANEDALLLTFQPVIVKTDQGALNPLVATGFIVKYKTAIAVAIADLEGNQLCTDEKLLYLFHGVEVFFIHNGFHSPIMNKRGVSVLVQRHFILDKRLPGAVVTIGAVRWNGLTAVQQATAAQ